MRSDQWMAWWEETTSAWDWTDYLKNAEHWSTQGLDLWKEMQTLVQSTAAPQAWLEAATAMTEAWDAAIRSWGQATSPDAREAEQKALTQLTGERDAALAEAAAQKKEITRLKRSVTQKERSLSRNKQTVTEQRRDLTRKDRLIKTLEEKVKTQAERLLQLEARAKAAPAPSNGRATSKASSTTTVGAAAR